MNYKSLLLPLLLFARIIFPQQYPLVTLHDINFVNDTTGWPTSPLAGDTVRVRGVVMARPVVDSIKDRRSVLYFGTSFGSFIESEDKSLWGGLTIYQQDTTKLGTFFDRCDTGITYEFTGVVTPYLNSTELYLITTPLPIPISLISPNSKRPGPVTLTLDNCFNADGTFNVNLRKYQNMYVMIVPDSGHPNIITSGLITGTSTSAGSFYLDNGNGRKVEVYAQSRYFKTASSYALRPSYTPPPNGTILPAVKGVLVNINSAWEIIPLYPEDLNPNIAPFPLFTSCTRNPGVVHPNTDVTVRVTIMMDPDIQKVQLFKSVNDILDSITMNKGANADSNTYTCVIPGISTDSAFVSYYIKATDSYSTFTNPYDINESRYSYFILNNSKPLTIQHVRYSPFGSGYSGYNGYPVTVAGIVTADTTSIPGNHSTNPARVYIQNGTTQWSGINIGYQGPAGMGVLDLKKGDSVIVTGTPVFSSISGTRLDTLTSLTVVSHSNPLPAVHIMKTQDVGYSNLGALSAEPWNGSIVKYENITIDKANADGIYNYGESYCTDASGGNHTRITWCDGGTRINAGPTSELVNNGDTFSSITGILSYTHSNYKICPRNDGDLEGYVIGIKENANLPLTDYKLKQNYPNPFNPSTVIAYEIPRAGLVVIKILNVLGEEVKTLVSENQSAGMHSVLFNAGAMKSGVYFYRLSSGNYVSVKKMIVLK